MREVAIELEQTGLSKGALHAQQSSKELENIATSVTIGDFRNGTAPSLDVQILISHETWWLRTSTTFMVIWFAWVLDNSIIFSLYFPSSDVPKLIEQHISIISILCLVVVLLIYDLSVWFYHSFDFLYLTPLPAKVTLNPKVERLYFSFNNSY